MQHHPNNEGEQHEGEKKELTKPHPAEHKEHPLSREIRNRMSQISVVQRRKLYRSTQYAHRFR